MELYGFIIVVLLIASVLGTLNRMRNDIARTNVMLQKIAKQVGLSDSVLENLDDELRQLIANGKKIEAIKRYREATGLGLKESKEYVDSLDN